jgi:hypothetical protein
MQFFYVLNIPPFAILQRFLGYHYLVFFQAPPLFLQMISLQTIINSYMAIVYWKEQKSLFCFFFIKWCASVHEAEVAENLSICQQVLVPVYSTQNRGL